MLLFLSVCFLLISRGSAYTGYVLYFVEGLKPNSRVTINIEMPLYVPGFSVKCAIDSENIPFHFSVHYEFGKKGIATCRTMKNSVWEKKALTKDADILVRGEKYKLEIEYDKQWYKVRINGNFYLKYKNHGKPGVPIKYMAFERVITSSPIEIDS